MDGAKLGASTKFIIQIAGEGGATQKKGKDSASKRILFLDALCVFLRALGDAHSERVLAFLTAEHFDSDSVHAELGFDAGNLASDIEAVRAELCAFRRDFGIDARSFSTGLAFQYHEWYAKEENADKFENKQNRTFLKRMFS